MLGILVIFIIVVGGYFYVNSEDDLITGDVINNPQDSGESQKVIIGMKNGNYYPNTITVKANQPVEITLDNSVGGCFRSFVIKDFGVSKYSKDPSQKIVFTPTKTGTFRFQCGMGMGTGTLIVE